MRKVVAACLAGFIVGVMQALYFSAQNASLIEAIASPVVLLAILVGCGSGLAANETDNIALNIITGIAVGVIIYSFLGYYSGMYLVAIVLGVSTGAIAGFVASVS